MDNINIKRENGKVYITDDYTLSITLDDDSELKDKIMRIPHLRYWDKIDIIQKMENNK